MLTDTAIEHFELRKVAAGMLKHELQQEANLRNAPLEFKL